MKLCLTLSFLFCPHGAASTWRGWATASFEAGEERHRWKNMTEIKNPNSDSGAGTAKSLSVPQLSPIFSYPTEGGNVYIYVVKAGFAVFVFATFDDTHAEYAYAIETLVSKPALVTKPDISPTKVVYDMLEQAEREFYDPFISNPFKLLKEDHEARTRLIVMLRKFLDASGE